MKNERLYNDLRKGLIDLNENDMVKYNTPNGNNFLINIGNDSYVYNNVKDRDNDYQKLGIIYLGNVND